MSDEGTEYKEMLFLKQVQALTGNCGRSLYYCQMKSHLQGRKLGYSWDTPIEMRWDKE